MKLVLALILTLSLTSCSGVAHLYGNGFSTGNPNAGASK